MTFFHQYTLRLLSLPSTKGQLAHGSKESEISQSVLSILASGHHFLKVLCSYMTTSMGKPEIWSNRKGKSVGGNSMRSCKRYEVEKWHLFNSEFHQESLI